jgi:REP element-mobilizing transposase RayT
MGDKPKYNPQIHRRRSIRLPGYDYTQNGAYFITICTKNKKHLFGEIVTDDSDCPKVVLNAMGKIAERCWLKIPDHFTNIIIDEFVIMPNHVHGIIIINGNDCRGTACRAPTTGTIEHFGRPATGSIPTIIRSYKSAVTRCINRIKHTSGNTIWQRNYYEHVIRNDDDLYDTRKYTRENSQKWDMDEYNPAGRRTSRENLNQFAGVCHVPGYRRAR